MSWLVLGGSLAAVLALAAIAWALKLGGGLRIENEEAARSLAREVHAGFRPAEVALDREGRAALVRADDGALILLRPHGARIAARSWRAPPAVSRDGPRLKIATSERMFGEATLDLGEAEAARWEELLIQRRA
ncbi:MAG: hypothetical protein H7X93_06245 [Sphingomonadaceae bacterium]|nr:hypothetical protein [Sphingomonadaceae bacterium]